MSDIEPSFLSWACEKRAEGGEAAVAAAWIRRRGEETGGFSRVEEIEKSELKDGPMRKKRVSPPLLSPPLLEYLI